MFYTPEGETGFHIRTSFIATFRLVSVRLLHTQVSGKQQTNKQTNKQTNDLYSNSASVKQGGVAMKKTLLLLSIQQHSDILELLFLLWK
jgi:hypothetical protein